MPRVPDLDLDALDAEQRRVHDAIVAGPRGGVHGPLRVWLHSPGLADRALVELVGILGYYTLISMTINAFQVPPPDGTPEPFPGP